MRIYVEAPSGESFEADIPCGTKIGKVAADFFESQGWPSQDRRGRGQKVVVDLVNPENPEDTKRLNSDQDICESGINDGDTVRVFPESVAGVADQRARLMALTADYNDILALREQNPQISFEANRTQAPDLYEVTFRYDSFVEFNPGDPEPVKSNIHRAEIILGPDYPRRAPLVTWQTPIFHPNIHQPDGAVCLGVLGERYLPGLGLARVVRMLVEMIQWRNFDASHSFNLEAARWAADTKHWPYITAIGGHPVQGPIEEIISRLDRVSQPPIIFRRLTPGQ